MPDIVEYYTSIGKELWSTYNRVRNLVNHHGEDGRYKEVMLRKIIQRFLPSNYGIGTGFVASRGTDRARDYVATSQIDIIVYNKNYPILFSEDDFIIVIPEAVRGIIEVKSNLENLNINDVIAKSNNIGNFIMQHRQVEQLIFNGIFGFDGFNGTERFTNFVDRNAKFSCINHNDTYGGGVNHIVFNDRYFMKKFNGTDIGIYDLKELNLMYFIHNLITYISNIDDIDYSFEQALWFPEDKELNRLLE